MVKWKIWQEIFITTIPLYKKNYITAFNREHEQVVRQVSFLENVYLPAQGKSNLVIKKYLIDH